MGPKAAPNPGAQARAQRAPSPVITAAIVIAAGLLGGVAFWSRLSPGDVRGWTPSDHDQAASTGAPASTVTQADRRQRPTSTANLVELAWQRSCTPCHGDKGQGDGPQGPMVRAPDLTRDEWQARVEDDDIAQVIVKGRNKMPAFDLPPAVIRALVKRIRMNRAGGARP
jgi:mono/diheme cytochrome c family protein